MRTDMKINTLSKVSYFKLIYMISTLESPQQDPNCLKMKKLVNKKKRKGQLVTHDLGNYSIAPVISLSSK